MPFPTPTNGISSALAVSLAGTGLVQLGTQVQNSQTTQNAAAPGTNFAAWFSGSGIPGRSFAALPGAGSGAAGATDGTAQYGLTLSLGSKGGFNPTCQLTTTVLDTQDNTQAGTPVYVSFANPSGGFFNPKTASTGFPVPTNSNGQVASVSGSGLITALSVGQALIEVQVPFANNNLTNMSGDSQDPVARQEVYAQVIVQVVP